MNAVALGAVTVCVGDITNDGKIAGGRLYLAAACGFLSSERADGMADDEYGRMAAKGHVVWRQVVAVVADKLDGLPIVRQARRRWLLMGVVVGAAVACALCVAVVACQNYPRPEEETARQVLASESELLAAEAEDLLGRGDVDQAVQVAMSALPKGADDNDVPFVPAAQMALEDALGVYPKDGVWAPSFFSRYGLQQKGCAYSDSGLLAAFDRAGNAVICDVDEGVQKTLIDISAKGKEAAASNGKKQLCFVDERIVCAGCGTVSCYEIEDGSQLWNLEMGDGSSLAACAVSSDAKTLAILARPTGSVPALNVIDVDTGELRKTELSGFEKRKDDADSIAVAFDESGSRVACGIDGVMVVVNLADGSMAQASLGLPLAEDVGFFGDEVMAVSADSSGVKACAQAFGSDLSELWSHEDEGVNGFDADGMMLASRTCICGQQGFGKEPLVFTILQGVLVGLDPLSGTESYRLERDAPIIDCFFQHGGETDSGATDVLLAVSSAGEVLIRTLQDKQDKGSANAYDTRLGDTTDARFVLQDGVLHLVMWCTNPDKCRSYVFGGRGMMLDEGQVAGLLDAGASYRWSGDCRVAMTDSEILLLDEASLDPVLRIDLSALPKLDHSKEMEVCSSKDEVLYVYGAQKDDGAGGIAVYKVSTRDGSVLGEFPLRGLDSSFFGDGDIKERSTRSGERCLLAFDSSTLRVLDADDGTVLQDVSVDGGIEAAYLVGDVLLVYRRADSLDVGSFETFDVTSGDPLDVGIGSYAVWDDNKRYIAVDEGAEQVAIGCSDGVVRLFDISNQSMLWESSEITLGIRALYIVPDSGRVLLQDEHGHLMLLSGADGSVLAASSAIVPPLDWFSKIDKGDTCIGYYKNPGLAQNTAIVVISTANEEFGPVSTIRYGMFANADASRVAIWDVFRDQPVIARRLTLDQLLEMGEIIAQSRPLNDMECLVYKTHR